MRGAKGGGTVVGIVCEWKSEVAEGEEEEENREMVPMAKSRRRRG